MLPELVCAKVVCANVVCVPNSPVVTFDSCTLWNSSSLSMSKALAS